MFLTKIKKKQKILLLLVFSFIISFAQAQDSIRIRGVFREYICSISLTFNSFSAGFKPLAEVAIKDNSFYLSLPGTIAPGVYRVQYNQGCGEQFVDVIVNGIDKEISFDTNLNSEFPSFMRSEENRRWSNYQKQSKCHVSKLGILYNFLSFYPSTQDKVVLQVTKAVTQERRKYYDSFENFIKRNKGTWAGEMVSNQPHYFSDPKNVPTRRDFIRRDYYWDDINTNDPKLMNSPLYRTLIDNYLDFQSTTDYTASQLEDYLRKRSAVIMQKFGDNATTKAFALRHLKEGFIAMGQYSIAIFIENKYGLSGAKL
ncbi:hypothetical protein ACM55I_13775 [Flavobacterium sp. GB2R13]|uniref:hypothetical protein n=1 Tax=Flavobacterium algoris TaxID=3398733 RepID=UPI003A878C15